MAVAKQVRLLVLGLAPDGDPNKSPAIVNALTQYAQILKPWATSVAGAMVADVFRRDWKLWHQNSVDLGQGIRSEIKNAPTGALLASLQAQQVDLITSLPLEAAKRVHELSVNAIPTGTRASTIAREILATGQVTEGRARLIARTEVARASSNLVQARSQYAGSDGYIWRTSTDDDVRPSHQEMEGKYVRWSEPPTLDNLKGHAGTLPNCRCYAEPLFPDD